jgi:hypothetical protein
MTSSLIGEKVNMSVSSRIRPAYIDAILQRYDYSIKSLK